MSCTIISPLFSMPGMVSSDVSICLCILSSGTSFVALHCTFSSALVYCIVALVPACLPLISTTISHTGNNHIHFPAIVTSKPPNVRES